MGAPSMEAQTDRSVGNLGTSSLPSRLRCRPASLWGLHHPGSQHPTETHTGLGRRVIVTRAQPPRPVPPRPAPPGRRQATAGTASRQRGLPSRPYLQQQDELREPLHGLRHQAVEGDAVRAGPLALLWGHSRG